MTKKLSKKDLDYFKKLLLEKRAVATGDLSLVSENASSGGPASGDSADLGSGASEQDYMLNLLESGTNVVREIDDALERIDNGTYGICEKSGKPIGRERLKAIPWAKLSIEAQREEEQFR